MRSSSETARSRRASYQKQRSHTFESLPLQPIQVPTVGPLPSLTDQRNSLDSQDEAGSASEESRLLGGSTDGSPLFHVSTKDSGRSSREIHHSGSGRGARLTLAKNLSFQNVVSENGGLNHHHRQRQSSGGGSTRSSRVFLRKSSDNDLLYGCSSSASNRMLERSPSSSSALLAKVKDRIVDTFFQTSSEGPHLAAIVQERRQRAAEEYEARLSIFRRAQHQQQQQLQTGSLSSDSGSTERVPAQQGSTRRANRAPLVTEASVDTDALRFAKSRREGARAAFRRRSVSEDNCLPQSLLGRSRPVGNGSVAGGSQLGFGGIVCSTDDFQALVSGLGGGHRRGLSFGGTRSRCMGPRAMSFDQSRTLRPCGSLSGGGGGDCGGSCSSHQRLNNSSKILETFEEDGVPSSLPIIHPGDLTHHSPDDNDPTYLRNNHHHHRNTNHNPPHAAGTSSGDIARRLSAKDTSEDDGDGDAEQHHHHQPGNCCVESSVAGSDHVTPPFVPEVEFDANGQTWEVYGAELDPEILGCAIQIHLGRLIARNKAEDAQDAALYHANDPAAMVTCPPSPRDRHSIVVVNDGVPNGTREHADVGCLRRYLCVFSGSEDS